MKGPKGSGRGGKTQRRAYEPIVKIRGKAKPKKPPVALEPVRPNGAKRCQYWDLRGKLGTEPQFYQCPNPARRPARNCAQHGAGTRQRVLDGERKDVVVNAIQTGEYAQPETLRYLFDRKPELRARYEQHLDSASLLDLRPQLATAKTLLDHFLQEADLNETMGPKGSDPPILRAVNAARTIVRLAGEMVAIEEKLGPLTHADVERLIHVFADCLNRFVPAEQRDAAIEWCQNEIRVARISALARTAKGEEPRDGQDGGGGYS